MYLPDQKKRCPLCFDAQTMQEQKLRIEENHLVVRPNIQNDPQQ